MPKKTATPGEIRLPVTSDTGRLLAPLIGIAPVSVWLGVQALAILLAAFRVPLWLHAPEVGETLAVYVLLIVQILAASLLFTQLTQGWRSTTIAIAAVWPFAVLAGFLANVPTATILHCGAYVTAWLIVLSLWNVPLASTEAHLTATSIASAWAAAGPVLLFVGYEYSAVPLSPPTPAQSILLGPIVNALSLASSEAVNRKIWPWIGLIMVGGLALLTIIVKMALTRGEFLRSRTLKKVAK